MPFYTEAFDEGLDQIPLYQRYPALKPFVGNTYGTNRPRILMIGESHYLPKDSDVHLDADLWYQGSQDDLSKKETGWLRTRGILDKHRGDWRPKGHTIYRRMEKALIDAGIPADDSVFKHVAFMNAFQRPAKEGDSIQAKKVDNDVAADTIDQVISVLKPDRVLFVSTKARKTLAKRLSMVSDGVKHPASPWWYRLHRNETAKDRFTRLITEYLKAKE